MLKQIALGIVLLAGLSATTVWAGDSLFDAAKAGDKAKVEALLDKGADVNTKDFAGRTPLHVAALLGKNELAELLISKGADVNAKDIRGETPLHMVASYNKKEVAELLISKGADVNAKSDNGETPLHSAAYEGRKEIAELLISKGADVNAKMNYGETPLDMATEKKKNEVVALLQAALQMQEEMSALLQAALQNKSSNQRETFNRVIASYKGRTMSDDIRLPFIMLAAKLKPAPAVPEEAIKYEGRAQFAFKNAESPADVLSAAKEYEKAVAAAPWVPGYYSDLCTIYEKAKKYAEAKKNCEFFLASSPSAQEASDTNKRIAGLEFAIEKTNSPEAQAARQAESQLEKDAALKKTLDGAVFVKRLTFDYGTGEWEIRINPGGVTYSYDVIEWATSEPACEKIGMRRPCGTWRQILMNSGYSGGKSVIASGSREERKITLTRTVSTSMLEAGSMQCEVSSDAASVTCSGELLGGKTWIFHRR